MNEIIQTIKEFFSINFAPVEIKFDWGFFFGALGTWLGILAIIKDKRKENKEFELIQGDSVLKSRTSESLSEKKMKPLLKRQYI